MNQHLKNYSEKLNRALSLDAMNKVPELGRALREAWRHGRNIHGCTQRRQLVSVEPGRVVVCLKGDDMSLVVPNTVKESFTSGDGLQTRSALGMENKRTLLTVARMDSRQQYKGKDRVISALPYVLAHGHDVEYFVVGEGDDRTRLESLAREVGVSDRVRFFGATKLQYLTDLYRTADLFVMASAGEGFRIAFLEAMISGTHVLGLDIAGARNALADGELGTIVSKHELPAAIVRLLAKPKPDPVALAAAARARFGREKFAAGVPCRVQSAD